METVTAIPPGGLILAMMWQPTLAAPRRGGIKQRTGSAPRVQGRIALWPEPPRSPRAADLMHVRALQFFHVQETAIVDAGFQKTGSPILELPL